MTTLREQFENILSLVVDPKAPYGGMLINSLVAVAEDTVNPEAADMPMPRLNTAELSEEELLVLLIEECAEVQKAATKCLRFGFRANHIPEYGVNSEVLAREMGELHAVANALYGAYFRPMDCDAWRAGFVDKMERALEAKRRYGVKNDV